MHPLVSISIVTWNSYPDIVRCLHSVLEQDYPRMEIMVVDNGSSDATRKALKAVFPFLRIHQNHRNRGYACAHNQAIRRTRGDFVLLLNPDVVLASDYISLMVRALQRYPSVGMATGKLWRFVGERGPVIDTTGVVMTRNHRHLDRGFNTIDRGQFDEPRLVFGVSGCCAFLRRTLLEDVAHDGEYLDEDFFAYREDVDLCWRAQWRGWRALYLPAAKGFHRRHVHPWNRAEVSPMINRLSVQNRFLLRIKNQHRHLLLVLLLPTLVRDLQVLGYVLVKEHTSLPAIGQLLRLLPRFRKKRRFVLERRTVPVSVIKKWFYRDSLPLSALDIGSRP